MTDPYSIEDEAQKSAVYFDSGGVPLAEVWYSDLGTWSVTGFAGERVRQVTGKGAEAIAREIALEIAAERLAA
jgi:hypothetical protein